MGWGIRKPAATGVVGTGYVGLVSGACFSDFGHHVTCVDKDDAKISSLRRGEIPIFEPDLERLVQSNARAGRLVFTTDLAGPATDAEAVFIAVGTPSRRGDGHADLSYVYGASREIAKAVGQADVKDRLTTLGFKAVANRPEEFGARIKLEMEKWGKVVRDAKLRIE